MFDWRRSPLIRQFGIKNFKIKDKVRSNLVIKSLDIFSNFKILINSDAFRLKFKDQFDIKLIEAPPTNNNYDPIFKHHYLPDLPKDLQERYNQLAVTSPQNLETATTIQDLTKYQKPNRYKVRFKKVITKSKSSITTIHEEYRTRRNVDTGKRRQDRRVKYRDKVRVGDILYERNSLGLLIPTGYTGITFEEKIIGKNLVTIQAQINEWKRIKKGFENRLTLPRTTKEKSIVWKEVFRKWKLTKSYKVKRKKLSEDQLNEIDKLYAEEIKLLMKKENDTIETQINKALIKIREAETAIKIMEENRKGKAPILMRHFDILRKGKPDTHKKIPITVYDFVPRRAMLEFMKGYDTSEIEFAIDSIIANRSITQSQLIHEDKSPIQFHQLDLTKIKVLSFVKAKKISKKVKFKKFRRKKYRNYQLLSIYFKKENNEIPILFNSTRSTVKIWKHSDNCQFPTCSNELEPVKEMDVWKFLKIEDNHEETLINDANTTQNAHFDAETTMKFLIMNTSMMLSQMMLGTVWIMLFMDVATRLYLEGVVASRLKQEFLFQFLFSSHSVVKLPIFNDCLG
jgi:predicted metal-binding transcription factor (methanogenesis marker protein 9)